MLPDNEESAADASPPLFTGHINGVNIPNFKDGWVSDSLLGALEHHVLFRRDMHVQYVQLVAVMLALA